MTRHKAFRTIHGVKRIWNELDYAQRRSFEIKTGIPTGAHGRRPRISRTVEELERLYVGTPRTSG